MGLWCGREGEIKKSIVKKKGLIIFHKLIYYLIRILILLISYRLSWNEPVMGIKG